MILNNELNHQLGRISEIRQIDEYLRGMTFGRRLFGCDLDDVQDCLAEVGRRYKSIVASLLSQQGQVRQMQELQERLAQKSEWVQWYERENTGLRAANEQLRQELAALHARLTHGGYYN